MMPNPYTHNIVVRMRNFLVRQIGWSETLRNELFEIAGFMNASEELEESRLLSIVEKSERSSKQSRVLQEEFHALKREWDNSESITPAERAEIRSMGEKAQSLSRELAGLYTQNSTDALREASTQRGEMTEMKRLSKSLHKYRTDDDSELSFLDRKA